MTSNLQLIDTGRNTVPQPYEVPRLLVRSSVCATDGLPQSSVNATTVRLIKVIAQSGERHAIASVQLDLRT
jgi:hypothetical protein